MKISEELFVSVIKELYPNLKDIRHKRDGYPCPDMVSDDGKIIVEIGNLSTKDGRKIIKTNNLQKIDKFSRERIDELFDKYPKAEEVWVIPYPKDLMGVFVLRFSKIIHKEKEEYIKTKQQLQKEINELLDDKKSMDLNIRKVKEFLDEIDRFIFVAEEVGNRNRLKEIKNSLQELNNSVYKHLL